MVLIRALLVLRGSSALDVVFLLSGLSISESSWSPHPSYALAPHPIRASSAHWGPGPIQPQGPATVSGLSRAPAWPALGSPPNPSLQLQLPTGCSSCPQSPLGSSGWPGCLLWIQLWPGHNRVPEWFSKTNLLFSLHGIRWADAGRVSGFERRGISHPACAEPLQQPQPQGWQICSFFCL